MNSITVWVHLKKELSVSVLCVCLGDRHGYLCESRYHDPKMPGVGPPPTFFYSGHEDSRFVSMVTKGAGTVRFSLYMCVCVNNVMVELDEG